MSEAMEPLHGNVWSMWEASPVIVVGCLLVLAVYLRGFRRRQKTPAVALWRAASFVGGVVLTYVVLQSPFEALADHIFWVHRIQHVALHHWIPMLLALAAPIPELIRGLGSWPRRRLLKPLLRSRAVRASYAFIQHPVIAPVLFCGVIYFWLDPRLFDLATRNQNIHDLMHLSMLAEGIPFWWLMFDPKPGRLSYLGRIVILWLIMFPQIMLGAYITFTHHSLYPIYATLDAGWVSSYATDQQIGGLIVWIPTCMMSVLGIVIVLRLWWSREHRKAGLAWRGQVIENVPRGQ